MNALVNRMLVVILCAGLFLLQGCVTRLGDFTVLSTKNVNVAGLKPGDRFSGEDCITTIVGINIGEVNWKNAMDQGLERGKGDVMVDVVLTQTGWSIGLVSQNCVVIEGTVSQSSAYKG